MRYLPASTCPMSGSSFTDFFSTVPSVGHRVFVSAYCLPHFGHLFIVRVRGSPSESNVQGIGLERITPLSRGAMSTLKTVMMKTNAGATKESVRGIQVRVL